MVDVAISLNVRIAYDLIAKHRNEGLDCLHSTGPQAHIEVGRRPGIDLLARIIARGKLMDGREEHAKQRNLVTRLESTNFHRPS